MNAFMNIAIDRGNNEKNSKDSMLIAATSKYVSKGTYFLKR